MAIFRRCYQPLQADTKQQIFQQHRRGDTAEVVARRFCRSCNRIYGIIKEIRAARIVDLPLDSMGAGQFAGLRTEKEKASQFPRASPAPSAPALRSPWILAR